MPSPTTRVCFSDNFFNLLSNGRHCIYMVIELNEHVDREKLTQAVRHSFKMHPVLASRLREGWIPRWLWTNPEQIPEDDCCPLRIVESREAAFALLPFEDVSATQPPLCKVFVYRTPKRDIIAVKFSHLAGDGAAVIAYVRLLSSLFETVRKNEDLPSPTGESYHRGFDLLARGKSARERWKIFLSAVRQNRSERQGRQFKTLDWEFPTPPENASESRKLIFRRISPEITQKLETIAQSKGASLNDLLLAGLYIAAGEITDQQNDGPRAMLMTMDLRSRKSQELSRLMCNLSVAKELIPEVSPRGDFNDILMGIIRAARAIKRQHVKCAYSLSPFAIFESTPVLSLIRPLIPLPLLKRAVTRSEPRRRAKGVRKSIILTNVGNITLEENCFGGYTVGYQFITADTLYNCGFVLGSWNQELTIGAVCNCEIHSPDTVEDLADRFVSQLVEITVRFAA